MKLNIAYAFLASLATLALGSCSEGKYWNEPDNYGSEVAFTKPAVEIKVGSGEEAPSSYVVTLNRTNSDAAQTVDVNFTTSDPDVLSGEPTVTFEAGKNTADYVINIGSLVPGLTYTATISVENPEDSFVHVDSQNLSFSFSISSELTWTSAGTAQVTSLSWVDGETGTVAVEEGNWPVAGQRLFRLIDVYHVLEPDYAEAGTELRFLTDDAGNALEMFQAWTYIGETYDGEYCMFGCPAQYGCSFTNSGNDYIMDGVIGTAASLTGSVTPGWYETLEFVWNCPAK